MRIVLKTASAPKPILAQNVPTYGHEHSQSIVDKGSERMTTDETAAAVLRCVGGKANVLGNSLCMTRLRLSVANPTLVDREGINSIAGVLGTTTRGANGIEVVFGPRVVQEVFDSFEALTGLDSTNEKMPPSTGFTPSNLRVHINPNHGEAEHDATELARELDSIASRGDDTGEHDLEDLTQMLLDSEPEPSAQTDDSLYDEDGKRVLVINGPNINMLGIREPELYGKEDFPTLLKLCKSAAQEVGFVDCTCYQSNHEGDLVDKIQDAYQVYDGIVINPGAYTHTSIAILDALKAVSIPTVEVHISKVDEREEFRQISYVRAACFETIMGMGIQGYEKAIRDLAEYLSAAD